MTDDVCVKANDRPDQSRPRDGRPPGRATRHAPPGGYRLRVGKDPGETFGTYLAKAIAASGYPTPTDFARAADISPSAISRWIRSLDRPTVRMLEKIAPKLGADVRDLVALAYPEALRDDRPAPVARPAIHPLAEELGRMLDLDSPLAQADREYISGVVERLIDPYRRTMRKRRSA